MLTSTPFEGSRDVYEWISAFINIERGQSLRSFRLDRMNALAELSGWPEKCAPAIHVAGTKGKGSVTGMIAAILNAAGRECACYASPHVSDFRERLMVGNVFFSEEIYSAAGNELKSLTDSLDKSSKRELFDPKTETGEEPSFFELMTLWFFLCCRLARCGVMAVETGMGGRLDATNILDPLISVITVIELEHTEYLGKTIAAIAAEKAGIIKPGRPLILAEQTDEALNVFIDMAKQKNSPLHYLPDHCDVQNIKVNREGTFFDLSLKDASFYELHVPIPGEVQAHNAGLAALAVKTAFPGITEASIREGLAGFSLPARFERISTNPVVVVDGAHTRRSVDLCLKSFTSLYGTGGILIFGCVAGKDTQTMAELCIPFFSCIIITTPGSYKKSNPAEIFDVFTRLARNSSGTGGGGKNENHSTEPNLLFIPDTARAVETAIDLAKTRKLPVLGTGSFYLAGEIRDKI